MTYHWLIHAFSFLWMGDVQQNQAKIVLHSKIEKITSRHATYVDLFSTVSDSVINAERIDSYTRGEGEQGMGNAAAENKGEQLGGGREGRL